MTTKRKDIYNTLKANDFIVQIQGREFVKVQGYLMIAQMQFKSISIKTELLHYDQKEKFALFKAIVETEKGVFIGHGDASPMNTRGPILKAYIRQAETRAIGRALRWALGDLISITALEEIDLDQGNFQQQDNNKQQNNFPQRKSREKKQVEYKSENQSRPQKKILKAEGPASKSAIIQMKKWAEKYNGFDPMFEFCRLKTALLSCPTKWSDHQIKQFMMAFDSGKMDQRYDEFMIDYSKMMSDNRSFPNDEIDFSIPPF
tara:strand:- start:4085 stop:4864 length:780 start_codon:yes stop_codon:yes gene_type:complete